MNHRAWQVSCGVLLSAVVALSTFIVGVIDIRARLEERVANHSRELDALRAGRGIVMADETRKAFEAVSLSLAGLEKAVMATEKHLAARIDSIEQRVISLERDRVAERKRQSNSSKGGPTVKAPEMPPVGG